MVIFKKNHNRSGFFRIRSLLSVPLAIAMIIPLLLLSTGCGNDKADDSKDASMRDTIALSSKNFKVNNCMMSYFFFQDYYDAMDTYYDSYYKYYGLNTSISLKDQYCYEDDTWFDYFILRTKLNVNNYVLFAEAALDSGIELDDRDMRLIDKEIERLKTDAKAENLTLAQYITKLYGDEVLESDVRDALKLLYLSNKKLFMDSDGFTYTKDDYNDYYKKHKTDFLYCDYRSYTFRSEVSENATDDEKSKTYAATKALAEKFASYKDEKEYDTYLKNYITELNSKTGTEMTESELAYQVKGITIQRPYEEGKEFTKWAFAKDRKVGDITVLDDGAGSYTVYRMLKTSYRFEYDTKNIRQIFFDLKNYESEEDCLTEAQKVLELYEQGDKSEKSFIKLSDDYNEDPNLLYKDGLTENLDKNKADDEIEEWCYGKSRKTGDYDLIKTDSGYYLVYFAGDGIKGWQLAARNKLAEQDLNKLFEKYKKDYPVKVNDDNLNKIPGDNALSK